MEVEKRKQNEEEEITLCQTEGQAANAGNRIEVGKLHRVVGVATGHARQAQKVHREESHIERNQRPPEMDLAARFVVHHTGPLRAPVVVTGKHGVERAGHQHIVEVRHHVVGVL